MIFWLVLNLSFLALQLESEGSITGRMWAYQISTGIYVLDYFWNEEKMLTTWDIDYVSMSIISGYAGRGGHDEIIQRLLELDADRVWIMEGAARGGQLHIIEYFAGLSPLSQSEIDHLFKAACICGITKIAQYFVENNRDAIDINKGLNYTLDRYHNEDIQRYFRSIGATIPDDLIGDELTNALDEMIFNDEWYS